jgi:hypothetical protein
MRRCFRVRQCAENDPQKRDPRRRGYTLVFFAMLMFALMGLAALVIDLGFARLTQRQMQTAVDSAALEGLRWRDVNEWEEVPQGWLGDPDFITLFDDNEDFIGTITNDVDKDRIRRWAAQQVVLSTFDDDLESGNGDDGAFDGGGQFGAGPVVEFTGGAGDPTLVASQTMSVDPASPVYKPEFMNGTPSPSGFQVAMLRGGTGIPDADVYSVGPSLPYLFARGSMINRQVIQDGITVRATGVADVSIEIEDDLGNTEQVAVGAVKTAGPTIPSGVYPGIRGVAGVTPFAINNQVPGDDPVLCRVTHLTADVTATDTQIMVASRDGFPTGPFRILIGNEIIFVVDSPTAVSWTVVRGMDGTTPAGHSTNVSVLLHHSVTIGVEVSTIQGNTSTRGLRLIDSQFFRYVPVFSMVSGRQVIIGFRESESWTFDETTHRVSVNFAVGSRIIAENASALVLDTTGNSATWPPLVDAELLIENNQNLDHGLLAPVSVR